MYSACQPKGWDEISRIGKRLRGSLSHQPSLTLPFLAISHLSPSLPTKKVLAPEPFSYLLTSKMSR